MVVISCTSLCQDPRVASVVALALGYMLRQTRQLLDDRLYQTLQQSADSLLALSAPPPSDHPAVVQTAHHMAYKMMCYNLCAVSF